MADIELVIRIPEELYGQLIELENPTYLAQCVINGKQLPKGHGRLIDADALPLNAIDDANYGSNYIRVAPTIEEAIKTIKELMIACTSDSKYYKVGDMAIKALEQEPSGNLISRTEVRKFVEYIQSIKDKHNDEGSPINYGTICDLVIRGWKLLDDIKESLPPVNPQEPKTGHWIMPVQDDGMSNPIYYQVRCSKCGFDLDPQTWHQELHQYNADKYCPNCGARMESEET